MLLCSGCFLKLFVFEALFMAKCPESLARIRALDAEPEAMVRVERRTEDGWSLNRRTGTPKRAPKKRGGSSTT